jgi:hypothetical protein
MTAKAISVRSLDKPQDPPELLREYEGSSFIGPNSMVLSKQNSNNFKTQTVFILLIVDLSEKPLSTKTQYF